MASKSWEFVLRTAISVVLGGMAFVGMKYELICAVHVWSHALPWALGKCWRICGAGEECAQDVNKGSKKKKNRGETSSKPPSLFGSMVTSTVVMLSLPICILVCRFFSSPSLYAVLPNIIPSSIKNSFLYMFPITEMAASYDIVAAFYTTPQQKQVLHDMLRHLLFVTVHIQFGLGHIGIDFLTSEQKRKNMLIRMDLDNPAPDDNDEDTKANGDNKNNSKNGETKQKFDPSRKFRRSAPSFILFCVLPYMFQIILFGNLNNFSFMYVRNQIHNSVRIDELFNHVSFVQIILYTPLAL